MTRFALTGVLCGFVGTAVLGGLARAGDACTIATSGTSEPAKACARGGRPEAKKVMKKLVADANAKAKRQAFGCEGCHKDLDSYELTADARDDFKKLQALLAKK